LRKQAKGKTRKEALRAVKHAGPTPCGDSSSSTTEHEWVRGDNRGDSESSAPGLNPETGTSDRSAPDPTRTLRPARATTTGTDQRALDPSKEDLDNKEASFGAGGRAPSAGVVRSRSSERRRSLTYPPERATTVALASIHIGNDQAMAITRHNPDDVFPPYSNYAHAVEVPTGARTLYVSGLNGFELDGTSMPATFEGQAELVWQHLDRVLASAEMTFTDLVSIRFYLADAAYDAANVSMLTARLGGHRTARTVICARLLEPTWLIEVEAVAAAAT